MSGSYNSIGGFIKDSKSGKNIYELSGYWHGEMFIKDLTTGKKEVLFDATKAKPSYPKSRPIEEQAPRESQRLWASTTAAIKKADQNTATDEKSKIEDEQRREAAERGQNAWQPKLFKKAPPGDEEQLDWVLAAEVDNNAPPEKEIEQILAIAPILPGQEKSEDWEKAKSLPSQQNKPLPPRDDSTPRPQQQQQSQPPPPSNNDGGSSDLIDFGQNDSSATDDTPFSTQANNTPGNKNPGDRRSTPTPHELASLAQPANPVDKTKLQEALIPAPSGSGSNVGDPIRRMDSLGNEETFLDAED